MAGRRGYRSRQAMQKIVTVGESPCPALQQFFYLRLADFDEEVIVKRIRLSVALTNDDGIPNPGDVVPWKWAIIQTDTLQAPTMVDFAADTRIIATGLLGITPSTYFEAGPSLLYDHTLTMRKLKETAVWFIWQKCNDDPPSESLTACFYSQIHYLED